MKKRTLITMGTVAMTAALLLAGCGTKVEDQPAEETAEATEAEETTDEETHTAVENAWVEITEDEAREACSRLFKAPEGAKVLGWSKLDGSEADSSTGKPLIQLEFELDGNIFTARVQDGAAEDADISGTFAEWNDESDVTLANWGGGAMPAKIKRSVNDAGMQDLCTWYDIEIGISYSVSVAAADLEGFDIQAVAEQMYNADNEEYVGETDEGDKTGAPYFKKGVYSSVAAEAENPSKDYFYVFYDEASGYTDDVVGTGVPFACEQENGKITFHFGGDDEGMEDVFTVESSDGKKITGAFDDGLKLVLELEESADPDNFKAADFAGSSEDAYDTYEDANGWSVKYNKNKIEVNKEDNVVSFVYTGQSAGTNMVTATYIADKKPEDVIDELAEGYGDKATKSESTFPGTEDVKGYRASLAPAEDGSGIYFEALAREYMEGTLVFELTGHNSGDDAMDMEVSDQMAMIIDSLTFNN